MIWPVQAWWPNWVTPISCQNSRKRLAREERAKDSSSDDPLSQGCTERTFKACLTGWKGKMQGSTLAKSMSQAPALASSDRMRALAPVTCSIAVWLADGKWG